MRSASTMTNEEKLQALEDLQTFIESAVESEQPEPAPFSNETAMRIQFVLKCVADLINAQDTA